MAREFLCALIAALMVVVPMPAFADIYADCDDLSLPDERQISACTTIIERGDRESRKNLAEAYEGMGALADLAKVKELGLTPKETVTPVVAEADLWHCRYLDPKDDPFVDLWFEMYSSDKFSEFALIKLGNKAEKTKAHLSSGDVIGSEYISLLISQPDGNLRIAIYHDLVGKTSAGRPKFNSSLYPIKKPEAFLRGSCWTTDSISPGPE